MSPRTLALPELRVFIGWDGREVAGFHVLAHSIQTRASRPVPITPVMRSQLSRIFPRERGPLDSTDFATSRFLVPYLSGYVGYSLFLDCDMLMRTDVYSIWDDVLCACGDPPPEHMSSGCRFCKCRRKQPAVWVCQHDYVPKDSPKMDGQAQTRYPRKNWSSFVLFDNARCRALTPEYVNTAPGLALHRFEWLRDDEIGSLPLSWNYLIGEENQCRPEDAKVLHFTNGLPFMPGYENGPHSDEWRAGLNELGSARSQPA